MPPNHFLVATDLTDRAERALARALDLLPAAGRLTVLHVVPTGLPPELASEQQRSAKAFLASRLGLVPRQRASAIQSIVVTGGAFNAIIAEAIARAADLVIIGNPTTDHYADLFTGSTAERVIRFSDRPVLMVKHVPREHYQRILVAFDGSEGAPRAARGICFGTRRRVPHSTRVVAAPHLSWGNRSSKTEIQDENKRLKELIVSAAGQAVASFGTSARVTIDLVEDNPYLVIANQCSWADLLVMGTHSKGRLASTVSVGKLARHLLVDSSCDVLTSRP